MGPIVYNKVIAFLYFFILLKSTLQSFIIMVTAAKENFLNHLAALTLLTCLLNYESSWFLITLKGSKLLPIK